MRTMICSMVQNICLCVVLSLSATAAFAQPAGADRDPRVVFDQAVDDFMRGDIAASATGFDTLVELAPQSAPTLWQRGIVLYYAERYRDCRDQFESHRTVNPNDVENATWHFLCVAREETPTRARDALLPVGPDARIPMRQVYELYAGELAPEDVIAAGQGPSGEFFAHLYLGLYAEALGDNDTALEHIRTAAEDRYSRVGGYMHSVARVHLSLLGR